LTVAVSSALTAGTLADADRPHASLRTLRVTQVSPTRNVILADGGSNAGLALGDRGVVMSDGRPIAAAEVIYLDGDACGLRFVGDTPRPRPGDTIVLVAGLASVGTREGVNLRSQITAIGPGARWAWLDAGTTRGWHAGDTLVIVRNDQPIAAGRINFAENDDALVRLHQPGVYSHRPRPGDGVERVHTASSPGWVTHVAGVTDNGGGQRVLLAAMPRLGIAVGDRTDVFRDGAYVGFSRVTSWDADGAVAETEPSFCRGPVRPGDVAIARLPRSISAPRTGVIFRIDGHRALLSLGEADGVTVGTELSLDRESLAVLTVENVYPDHCGVSYMHHGYDSASPPPLPRWGTATFGHGTHEPVPEPDAPAERVGTDWPIPVPVGTVKLAVGRLERVGADWLIAVPVESANPAVGRPGHVSADWLITVRPDSVDAAVGRPVIVHTPTPRAGLVITRTEHQAIVCLVDEWYVLPSLIKP
jgi:hypothetical protein